MGKDNYKVGYGRPPKATRFRKGQSGNPSGKKKPPSLEKVLKRALSRKARVSVDGAAHSLPMTDVIVEALVRKAARGDLGAIRLVLATAAAWADESQDNPVISDHQFAMLMDILGGEEQSHDA